MQTITFEGQAGHPYHVYCVLGGNVYTSSPAKAASVSLTPLESYAAETEYSLGIGDGSNTYGGFTWTPGEAATPAEFADALNDLGNWGTGPQQPMETPLVHAELDEDTGKVVLTIVDENWIGTDGNRLKVKAFNGNLPISDEVPVNFSGGADYSRTLVGVMAHEEHVRVVPSAGSTSTTIEADIPNNAAVKFRDPLEPLAIRGPIRTVPGQFYSFSSDDEATVISNNTAVVQLPPFGGSGAFQATCGEVLVRTKPSTNIHLNPCAPCSPPAVYQAVHWSSVGTETGQPD